MCLLSIFTSFGLRAVDFSNTSCGSFKTLKCTTKIDHKKGHAGVVFVIKNGTDSLGNTIRQTNSYDDFHP